MTTNKANQISALKNAALSKKQDAMRRAKLALKEMQQYNLPINFQAVAKQASVAKSWLYKQVDLADQIKSLRSQSRTIRRTHVGAKQIARKNSEIQTLKQHIHDLTLENKQLKEQLEVVYGDLQNRMTDV